MPTFNALPTTVAVPPTVAKDVARSTFVTTINLSSYPSLVANDIIEFGWVPAGWRVTNLLLEVITPAGGVCTANVGDEDLATQFLTGTNLNAAAGTVVDAASTASKRYGADKKLRVAVLNTNIVASFRIGVTMERAAF